MPRSLKNKYNIDDATWHKIWRQFKILLVWLPLLLVIFAGITWAFSENVAWLPAVAVVWFFTYLLIILFSRIWLVRSKFTMFVMFTMISLFEMIFVMMVSVCAYRFFGLIGLGIQNSLLFTASIFLSRYYYTYWDKVWTSHETHNETVALDLENGRYDYLNNFDTSEDIVKETQQRKYSNPALINIVATVAPIAVSIPLIFSKFGDQDTPLIIVWIISIPFCLYFLKWVVVHFYMFRKLTYYENIIGKPIINGLLTECSGKKSAQSGRR